MIPAIGSIPQLRSRPTSKLDSIVSRCIIPLITHPHYCHCYIACMALRFQRTGIIALIAWLNSLTLSAHWHQYQCFQLVMNANKMLITSVSVLSNIYIIMKQCAKIPFSRSAIASIFSNELIRFNVASRIIDCFQYVKKYRTVNRL